jgi:argonaute-like protein implicated in RNA metabolism and viral defense
MKAYLIKLIRQAAENRAELIKTILLQRDGRVFDTEVKGAHEAIDQLKKDNVIAQDANLTIIEISKSAPVRFRLFDVSQRGNRDWVENPQIGNYCVLGDTEGYICTTGRAFPHKGTVRPLHIRRIEGSLSIEACLEDVSYLSCLTWTRPEDCSRYPITLKLNDRFLSEEATDYDENALELEAILMEEGEDEMEEVYD